MVTSKDFGVTKQGEEVQIYVLKNKNGMEAHISTYGAVIAKLYVPDKDGKLDDVILGFDQLEGYEKNEVASHGAVVGRVANRIGAGTFTLNDVTYKLDINNNGNCLHGGNDRYEYKVYKAYPNEEENSVTLKRISPHMEQGFPGNLNLSVEYRLNDENELSITYEARSDRDTPINITNHSYFNLKGAASLDLTSHEIMIRSSSITETDENLLPNGNIMPIIGTPMDLSRMTPFMEYQNADYEPLKFGVGFDHNYILDHVEGEPDAVAIEKISGRKMEMFTDLPGVQFYTGNWLNEEEIGKGGIGHKQYGGFCLETQFFPNSCNIPTFPNAILKAGEKYKSVTSFRFSIMDEKEEETMENMENEMIIEDNYSEYVTFHVTAKDGSDVEMAVVDEFDFENKHYVVGAVVKDDIIEDDGRYIYRCIIKEDDFTVEKINNAIDYQRIAEAYMDME